MGRHRKAKDSYTQMISDFVSQLPPVSTEEEVAEAYQRGELNEVFGTGTAAVISPVGELKWNNLAMSINNGVIGELSQRLYDEITGIQNCTRPDKHRWVYKVS